MLNQYYYVRYNLYFETEDLLDKTLHQVLVVWGGMGGRVTDGRAGNRVSISAFPRGNPHVNRFIHNFIILV